MSKAVATPGKAYVAMDYVYCGRRWSASTNKLYACVCPIKDGVLQEAMLFDFDRKTHRSVGGVYTGAEFCGNSVSGLVGARFARLWEKQDDLIDWQARDESAEAIVRSNKLEADAKRVSEIEKILLPLRIQYHGYAKRHDRAGMDALRNAVVNALLSPPRSSELPDK